MKLKVHKVLGIGAAIYVFLLAFGIYFMNNSTARPKVSQQEIIQILSPDADADDSQSKKSKAKGFSRLLLEDDDDSAKDLLIEMYFYFESFVVQSVFQTKHYAPFQEDITTPPPKA